ncbi:MAG: hypothetical protein WCA19_27715 [Candidatus Acidiferrales bacterium]
MAQSVYFDSQIIISVSDGVIPASAWKEVLEKLAGRYNYRVSFTTFMEIVNALAGGDDDHFGRNRKRLLVLTDVADCEFLPVPGQFIRTAVLGLPSERPQFAPEQLEKVWMPAIKQARDKKNLLFGDVVVASVPSGADLAVRIDLPSLRKEMEDGKKLWAEQLRVAKDGKKEMPPVGGYAAFILAFDVHAPRTQENIQRVSRALDAAYCHLAQIHHQSTKGAYKFENELQDWIDNQQLMYLADPDLMFVTADRRLMAKLSRSLDRHRVREFTEFAEDI